ncbi:S11IP protein, partial [Crypturellus soui]|nr:S11IP protein [Crypturellus soui]
GDEVLAGRSTLRLPAAALQHLTRLFEQHLGSRNQGRGFVALPSHPAESAALLQAQFLFDVLQKTRSLKLVHDPNCVLQSTVKIFPFKSLRHLEVSRGGETGFEPCCLESLTCCKCITTLEEIISACGGDLSCALPWLELQAVNFSHNSITALDDSLQLLNVLRVLNLSHNKVQDCEHYLMTLTELEYLNLAYNFLSKVPNLGIFSRSKLVTLILRNNELDSINGVEQLVNLQHLDVAYNLLLEHVHLAPLSALHCLKKLYLEGNPLWFHQNHRSATLVYVSPRAASSNFLLDGEPLSSSDLMHLPKLVQSVSQSIHTSTSEKTVLDRSALESSCAADLSDSQSPAENVAVRLPRKKCKGKVKVRRASISEPSDTDHESQALSLSAGLVLQHQKEIKRMDSFRDRFGADWLQYKKHMEEHDQIPVICHSHSADEVADRPAAMDSLNESFDPEQEKPQVFQKESSPPLDDAGKDDAGKEEEPELQVDVPVRGEQREEEADELMFGEEEEDVTEVDLCQPVLVSQIENEGDPEPDWIFLRVTAGHVIEVELKAARVLHKLELKCLQKVETSEMTWKRVDLERVFPVLTLHFSYIRKDRQKRKYVVLDDCPEQCLQCVLEVLMPALEENRRNQGQEKALAKLQCLKCKQEFFQSLAPWQQGSCSAEAGDAGRLETLATSDQDVAGPGEPIACPSCCSDHVVILPSEMCSSASLPPGPDATSDDLSESVLDGDSQQEGAEEAPALTSESGKFYIGEDSSEVDTSNSTRTPELCGEPDGALHSGSDGTCGKEPSVKNQCLFFGHTDTTDSCLMGSYRYSVSRGPTPSQLSLNSESEDTWNLSPSANGLLSTRDFRSVDHRLKLYLDMEVFEEDAEEFQCFLKVAVVKFGRHGEFLSILVASDLRIYVLEVTGVIRGQPADWLKKNDSHYLSDISHLEVGLCHQSLRIEFENPRASYNLLIRNQSRCDQFLQTLTHLMQELPAKNRSKVEEIPTVEMNPQHSLW